MLTHTGRKGMPNTRHTATPAARLAVLIGLAVLAGLALITAPARATIVLLGTSSSSAPTSQDANLYDWRGQWTSALDRAAPVPDQRPAWQVNVGLYGDWYQPPGDNIVEQNPTCLINLQITGAPIIQTYLSPCVEGPYQTTGLGGGLAGSPLPPVPELLTPNLAAAGNGTHTVTVTAYNSLGGASTSTSFNVLVDNTLPSPANMVGAVGWQRGGEVVSSTASTAGPSGIAGQQCAVGSAPASWYPSAAAQIVVTGDGRIAVDCTARNNAGVTGPTTQFNAMLDNSPPTGYFAARDPHNPALASVITADALSGVAGGQIQMQTAGGWQGLPTSYSPSTGQLSAAIPDNGGLPDGDYTLRAVVSDGVGNTSTVTTDQNGSPELVTEPLRIVTQLPVGRSRALVRRCTETRIRVRHRRGGRHQRSAARLVRRCAQVALPPRGAVVKLRFGQDATVTGLLQTADGTPVAGALVQVSEQAAGWRRHRAGTLTSNGQGEFRYTIAPGPSRAISFTYPGSATMRASLGTTRVRVFGRSGIRVSGRAGAGGRLRISGRVLGGYIPSGGVLVQLQYLIVGLSPGWGSFHTPVRTDDQGRWSVTFPVAGGAAGHTYLLRALVERQGAWPFMTTHSRAIARTVT
jgi:hypothetical protein